MLRTSFHNPRALVVAVFALPVFSCLLGCGSSGPAVGEVSGKVTFRGQPVGEGMVSFMNQMAGTGDEALLNKDGTYIIKTPLPVGDYKVMVLPLVVRAKADGKGPEVGIEKPAPNIPQKYRTIGTTVLKVTVKEGKNEHNFELKS